MAPGSGPLHRLLARFAAPRGTHSCAVQPGCSSLGVEGGGLGQQMGVRGEPLKDLK